MELSMTIALRWLRDVLLMMLLLIVVILVFTAHKFVDKRWLLIGCR